MSGRSTSLPCLGLRAARIARGETVLAAAASFGWKRTRWVGWETRGQCPRTELKLIAKVWGLQLQQLQGELEDPDRVELREAAVELNKASQRAMSAIRRFL